MSLQPFKVYIKLYTPAIVMLVTAPVLALTAGLLPDGFTLPKAQLPPVGVAVRVVLVVKVLVPALAQAKLWSVPALGLALRVTWTVSLHPPTL